MKLYRFVLLTLPTVLVCATLYVTALILIGEHYEPSSSIVVPMQIAVAHNDIDQDKVAQILKNSVNRKTAKGKEEYVFGSEWAYQFRTGNMELRDDVYVRIHDKEGLGYDIRSQRARYYVASDLVVLENGVTVERSDGVTLKADWVRCAQKEGRIQAGTHVFVTGPDYTLKCRRAYFWIKEQDLNLRGDVVLTYTPKGGKSPVVVKAQGIKGSQKKGRTLVYGDVVVTRSAEEAKASSMDLFFEPGTRDLYDVILHGGDKGAPASFTAPADPNNPSRGSRKLLANLIECAVGQQGSTLEEIAARDAAGARLLLEPGSANAEGRGLSALEIRIYPDRRTQAIARVQASDFVRVFSLGPGAAPPVEKARAAWADIDFDPKKGEPRWSEMIGDFHGMDQDWKASSNCMEYRGAEDTVRLRGTPSLESAKWRLAARELTLDQGRDIVKGEGAVQTELLDASVSLPAAPGDKPNAYVSAASMTYDRKAEISVYQGEPAVLLQGKSRITGNVIEIRTAESALKAGNGATARLFLASSDGARREPEEWNLRSQTLRWDAKANALVMTGAAELEGGNLNLQGETITVVMEEGSRAEKILCVSPTVSARYGGSRSSSERFEYTIGDRVIRLQGFARQASVTDEKGEQFKGFLLTLRVDNDRMDVISNEAGTDRTTPKTE